MMSGKIFRGIRPLFYLLLVLVTLGGCSGGGDNPFQFGPGGPEGSGSEGPRTVDNKCAVDEDCNPGESCDVVTGLCFLSQKSKSAACQADADCASGEVCDLSTGECRAPKTTCPGVSCDADHSLDTTTCTCVSTCAVNFEATLVLKGDSPVADKYDIPAACRDYFLDPDEGNYDPSIHSDLFCCANPPNPVTDHRYGHKTCVETPGQKRVNTLQYFPDGPVKLKFDLSDPARCRVFLEAKDFPNYNVANTALDAVLQIDAGQGEGDFSGLTAQGTCVEEGGSIRIENLNGLHFRVRFYNAVNAQEIADLNFNPFTDTRIFGSPQAVPPFEDDPQTPIADPSGLSLTTGSATIQPGVPPPGLNESPVGPVTTTGSPLRYDAGTNTSHLKIVTGVPISNQSAGPFGGQLYSELGGAALAADIEGNVTTPNGEPVTSLADIRASCGSGEQPPTPPQLALSVKHSWPASGSSAEGEEGVSLTGNSSQGFAGTTTFKIHPYRAREEEADVNPYYNNADVRSRFEIQEIVVIKNEATAGNLSLQPVITPADGAFQLAGTLAATELAPGESIPVPIVFKPTEGISGCNASGSCESLFTLSGNRLTLTLKGTGSARAGKLVLSEVNKETPPPPSCLNSEYGSDCGAVSPVPVAANDRTDYGRVLQNSCRSKVYRVANLGVLDAGAISLPLSDATGFFTRGQIRQADPTSSPPRVTFQTAPAISGSQIQAVRPTPDRDVFFYLRYCPTSAGASDTHQSQYSVSSNTGGFSFNMKGVRDAQTDAVTHIYISDFHSFADATCANAPKPADLIAPNGRCLYKVQGASATEGDFSLRSDSTVRDVYLVNGKASAGADSLHVTTVPATSEGDFDFTKNAGLPASFDLKPCTEQPGSGGSRCLSTVRCTEAGAAAWCKKVGTVQFNYDPGVSFAIKNKNLVFQATSLRSAGAANFTAHLKGAMGGPNGPGTLHVGRIFAGFAPKLANAVGIASSVTPGQVAKARLNGLPGTPDAAIDRFAIAVTVNPAAGEISIPGVNTPVPADISQRSPSGISLFNAPGSSESTSEFLYSFQCHTSNCRYFSAYLAKRCLLYNDGACVLDNSTPPDASYNNGSRGFYGSYSGGDTPVQALHPITRANDLRNSLSNADATLKGFYDPVTGEMTFKNNATLRLFSPDTPLFRTRRVPDADVTVEISLTTECVDPSLVPRLSTLRREFFPLNTGAQTGRFERGVDSSILNPVVTNSIINSTDGLSYYGPNPLPPYVAGAEGGVPSQCASGTLHGRRMWAGTDHAANIDNTATLDKVRPARDTDPLNPATNRFAGPNFDLAGIGLMRGNQNEASNSVIYLIIKACLGGPNEAPGSNASCQ
ncbi:MAG: hypothetical protein HYS22_02970 [Deltaproteobacteria bacterium]|nr:hypothetical protein [Deltaproteobacteria bacterium]